MHTVLKRTIQESITTSQGLIDLEIPLNQASTIISDCLISGRKLLICGNGSSASDATHLATEFLCRFQDNRRPYPAISLTANGEYLTAVCNDYHFDELFARQVWGLGQPGDVFLSFNSGGKPKNLLRAIEAANRRGIRSICFLGRGENFNKDTATLDLVVPGNAARVQEAHKLLFHVLCEIVEGILSGNSLIHKHPQNV